MGSVSKVDMDKRRMPRAGQCGASQHEAQRPTRSGKGRAVGFALRRAFGRRTLRSRGIGKHRKATKEERIAMLRYTLGASEGFQRSKHWAWTPA